jgi:hypothetical protein
MLAATQRCHSATLFGGERDTATVLRVFWEPKLATIEG